MYVCMTVSHGSCVEVRGQLVGKGSHLPHVDAGSLGSVPRPLHLFTLIAHFKGCTTINNFIAVLSPSKNPVPIVVALQTLSTFHFVL